MIALSWGLRVPGGAFPRSDVTWPGVLTWFVNRVPAVRSRPREASAPEKGQEQESDSRSFRDAGPACRHLGSKCDDSGKVGGGGSWTFPTRFTAWVGLSEVLGRRCATAKMNERSRNVYENKGSLWKTGGERRNVYENKRT